jgi:hypothetical protein
MYKYLIFVIFGILLYLFYNNYDNFNIGIPEYKIVNGAIEVNPIDNSPMQTENRIWTDPENNIFEGERNLEGNIEYYVWAVNPNNAETIMYDYLEQFKSIDDSCAVRLSNHDLLPTKEVLETRFNYTFNDALVTQGNFRLYDVNNIDMSSENYTSLQSIYEKSGNSISNFALIDSYQTKLYYLTLQLRTIDYIRIHSSKNTFNILDFIDDFKLYDTHEFVVARVSVYLNDRQSLNLKEFTTVPRGFGYGIKIMELLSLLRVNEITKQLRGDQSNPDYMRQIERFQNTVGSEQSYRIQFRLSVTEWAKMPREKFSIYKILNNLDERSMEQSIMASIYFELNNENYRRLFIQLVTEEGINIENLLKYNHFLMQLSEEDIETLLTDIDTNLENIRDLYR